MWRVTWKGLAGHKLRLALTVLAVVLGVSLVSGSYVFTDTLDDVFSDLFSGSFTGIDVQVRPEVAAQRRAAARRKEELFEDLRMQQEVDAGYQATIAELQAAGERIEIVDGEQSEDQVFAAILRLIG